MKQIKLYKRTLLTLVASLGLSGCGQPASENSHVQDALNKTVQQKESTLTPLKGRYEGVFINKLTQKEENVVLILIPTIFRVQNPGQNDVTEMPSLGGNLNVLMNPLDPSDVVTIAQFSIAKHDSDTGHLRLSGDMSLGSSNGTLTSTLEGEILNNHFTGTLSNTTFENLGTVNLQKAL